MRLAGAGLWLLAGCVLAACESAPEDPLVSGDPTVELTILEPARGAVLTRETSIVVRGIAWSKDGHPSVSVQGDLVEVDGDGEFSIEIPVREGLSSIETVVRDRSDHLVRDTRAILRGEARAHGELIDQAFVTYIGQESFDQLAAIVADYMNSPAAEKALIALNPVSTNGTECNGVEVDVTSLSSSAFDMQITSHDGGLGVSAQAEDLEIGIQARISVACVTAVHDLTLSVPRPVIEGDFRVGLTFDGHIDLGLDAFDADLSGLSMTPTVDDPEDAALLNGLIEDSIRGALSSSFSTVLEDTITPVLRRIETTPYEKTSLGLALEVDMRPRALIFDDDGGLFEASIAIRSPEKPDAKVIYTTPTPPLDELRGRAGGIQLGLNADVLNHYLALLWSADALRWSIPGTDPSAKLVNIDRVDVEFLLPPVVETQYGAVARVRVGDCIVKVIDAAGGLIAEVVVSGGVGMQSKIVDQRSVIELVDPELSVGLIGRDGKTSNSARMSPWLSEYVLSKVMSILSEGMGGVPDLGVPAVSSTAIDLAVSDGYLLMAADLAFDGWGDDVNAPAPEDDKSDRSDPLVEDAEAPMACGVAGGSGAWLPLLLAFAIVGMRRRRARLA